MEYWSANNISLLKQFYLETYSNSRITFKAYLMSKREKRLRKLRQILKMFRLKIYA